MAPAAGQVMHIDHRLFRLEGNIGQLGAVGRPGRRDDRLARGQCGLVVGAVGIGDLQFVAAGALHHVGDARGEHAGFASELLVDEIGDAVGRGAQLRPCMQVGRVAQRCLLLYVGQAHAGFVAAIGGRRHAATGDDIGAARLEVCIRRCGVVGQRNPGIDQAEQAAAFKVGAHHRGQGLADDALAGEFGDGHRQAVGAGAGDFHRELRSGGCINGQSDGAGEKKTLESHCGDYTASPPAILARNRPGNPLHNRII
jgi:hypothetical protein